MIETSEATFQRDVLQSELPVLIDLYADWCAPCKQLSPIVEQVADELADKLKVVKINIDKNPMLAQSLRVQSIPMLLLVHQGQLVDQHSGMLDKAGLHAFVKRVLPKDAAEIDPAELSQLLLARRVVPVDIRDEAAFNRYRIPGSIHIAVEQLGQSHDKLLPSDGRVRVLYSRSTDEAREQAETLIKAGVTVGYLKGGFLHWEADGLEVERGTPAQAPLAN